MAAAAKENKDNGVKAFDTEYGVMHYKVTGDVTGERVIVTYHDMGLNLETAFDGFFKWDSAQAKPFLAASFATVQISCPGQGPNDDTKVGDKHEHLDLSVLAIQVKKLLVKLGVKVCYGFGVGVGAYVMSEFAAANPEKVLGLVLFGVSLHKSNWYEWGVNLAAKTMFEWTTASFLWESLYIDRWFSQQTQKTNPALVKQYREHLHGQNYGNLIKFVKGFVARKDLSETFKTLDCPVLLFVGDNTPLEHDSMNAMGLLPAKSAEWVRLKHVGLLMMHEDPAAVLGPLKLWFNGQGLI